MNHKNGLLRGLWVDTNNAHGKLKNQPAKSPKKCSLCSYRTFMVPLNGAPYKVHKAYSMSGENKVGPHGAIHRSLTRFQGLGV